MVDNLYFQFRPNPARLVDLHKIPIIIEHDGDRDRSQYGVGGWVCGCCCSRTLTLTHPHPPKLDHLFRLDKHFQPGVFWSDCDIFCILLTVTLLKVVKNSRLDFATQKPFFQCSKILACRFPKMLLFGKSMPIYFV